MRELINDVLSEFTELSGEYIEAKKEDVLNRLCEILSDMVDGEPLSCEEV